MGIDMETMKKNPDFVEALRRHRTRTDNRCEQRVFCSGDMECLMERTN